MEHLNLKQISERVSQSSPVFIVGSPRSGSSVLYRTLQKLTPFKCKRENLAESKIIHFCQRSIFFREYYPVSLIDYFLNNQEIYTEFRNSLRFLKFRQIFLLPFSIFTKNNSLFLWKLGGNHLAIKSFFYYAKQARQCERILEKTPNNTEHSRKLLYCFPNCKLLYIYRHPIDVFSSYRKRSKFENSKWLKIKIENFCNSYEKSAHLAIDLSRKFPKQFMMIRYEDFVQNPREETERICHFIGEDFEEEAVIEKNPDLSKWKADPHLFGDIIAKTKKWEEFISHHEAVKIETRLQVIMKELGYTSYVD